MGSGPDPSTLTPLPHRCASPRPCFRARAAMSAVALSFSPVAPRAARPEPAGARAVATPKVRIREALCYAMIHYNIIYYDILYRNIAY